MSLRNAPAGSLLGTNEVFLNDSIITADEQATLTRWAEEKSQQGRLLVNPRDPEIHMTPFLSADGGLTRITKSGLGPDGVQRRATKGLIWVPKIDLQYMDPVPEAFWTIRTRVIELLGLSELEEDHYKGSFLTYMAPGGRVHEHRDARVRVNDEECLLLRCNLLFQRPAQGGMPIIGSQEIDIPQGGMWAFYPTEFRHSTTVVRGPDWRGTLSFGFLVRSQDLWQRRFRVARGAELRGIPQSIGAGGRVAAGVRERHSAVWEFVLSRDGDFSVEEIARSLVLEPAAASEVLRNLQEWQLVTSLSSINAAVGAVLLFREMFVAAAVEA